MRWEGIEDGPLGMTSDTADVVTGQSVPVEVEPLATVEEKGGASHGADHVLIFG